jgi:peptidoglycan-N-acetylglucosamine deacetylase
MIRFTGIIILFLIANAVIFAQDTIVSNPKQVAITLDDLPLVLIGRYDKEMQTKIFYDILNTLDKYEVKATGFVVGNKITEQHHISFLQEFVTRGHLLGNHSFSHPDLNKISIENYKLDILKCDSIISPLINGNKYFRYPLLHRGDSKLKKEKIYQFLKEQDYKIASVSIDNNDFTFNKPTLNAYLNSDTAEINAIRIQYIKHMQSQIDYFSTLSNDKLGRDMKHVLLLHMNFSTSLFLDDLLSMMKEDGWEFIQLDAALKDPVYFIPDNYCGTKGLGWLERITKELLTK